MSKQFPNKSRKQKSDSVRFVRSDHYKIMGFESIIAIQGINTIFSFNKNIEIV
jgi:hypothetical protein